MNPVPDLLRRGADFSFGRGRDLRVVDEVADQLIASNQFDPRELGARALTNMIGALYENGWQPLDLHHVVRRQQNTAVAHLAAAAIAAEADITAAATRAPEDWLNQLSELRTAYPDARGTVDESTDFDTGSDFLTAALRATGKTDYIAANDQWIEVLSLLGQWQLLSATHTLTPPPSQWPARRVATASGPSSGVAADPKMLVRIRGLLAKADATEFDEEADSFTAKAQELMTKYSIDSLSAVGGHPDVVSKRIHIDNPHAPAKAQLLHGVAEVNRVKTVWDPGYAIATVVGSIVDTRQTEILFTSLLVQATRALAHSSKTKRRKGAAAAAFGKAFLFSYAVRIAERLRDADTHVVEELAGVSGDLLPMLAAQSEAVGAEFDRLFPRVRTGGSPNFDAEGWDSGQAAANDADLRRGS
ncbi:MAG: DUF2786 domain-containing protein [Rhodococcus sp. (in: high G+C Gram-positive bacteria)]